MRRYSFSRALFIFMRRGEKLTYDAISNDGWDPHDRYVLWPHGEYWDVRFKMVTNGKLEWESIADKPFLNDNEARQAASRHWENLAEHSRI